MIISSLNKHFAKLTCALLFTTLLSGCGFYLKQATNVPPELKNIRLVSSKYSEFTRFIKQELKYNQINLVDDTFITDEKGDTVLINSNVPVLKIASTTNTSRTLSLYNDVSAAEHELSFEVKMEVRMPNQAPQYFTVALQRDQLNNSQEALAGSRESELLDKELRRAAAQQVVRKLSQVVVAPDPNYSSSTSMSKSN